MLPKMAVFTSDAPSYKGIVVLLICTFSAGSGVHCSEEHMRANVAADRVL